MSLCACANYAEEDNLPEILIGSDTYPPHLYFDNNDNPTGIDVDVAVEAFRRLDYVSKPIDVKALVSTIMNILNGQ